LKRKRDEEGTDLEAVAANVKSRKVFVLTAEDRAIKRKMWAASKALYDKTKVGFKGL